MYLLQAAAKKLCVERWITFRQRHWYNDDNNLYSQKSVDLPAFSALYAGRRVKPAAAFGVAPRWTGRKKRG
ncbi:MAG: hypothetical protein KJP10_10885, partial [Gammaproteobacteria bacterium]|nr:hypothetical protein [Gammaproteobacteria bacterium]